MNKPGCLQTPSSTNRILVNILDYFWTWAKVSLGNTSPPKEGSAEISRTQHLSSLSITRFIYKMAEWTQNSSSPTWSFLFLHLKFFLQGAREDWLQSVRSYYWVKNKSPLENNIKYLWYQYLVSSDFLTNVMSKKWDLILSCISTIISHVSFLGFSFCDLSIHKFFLLHICFHWCFYLFHQTFCISLENV